MDLNASTATTTDDLECILLDKNAKPGPLALSLLLHITNDFSEDQVIGRGAFGVVYKCILENGTVAVKRLLNPHLNEKQYQHEVECLMTVEHDNIVRFLGYCANTEGRATSYDGKFIMADEQKRLLCFEYIPNGSLWDYITDASSGLPWSMRFEIIKGICKGLNYLHENHIVHRDLKPHSILMDDKMVPKITDFGISRCFAEKQTHAITKNPAGTFGYLAPEYTSGIITYKFDLYSLGVIIMEILTGMKGFHLVEHVLQSWSNRLEKLQAHMELDQIELCANIGNECIDLDPLQRPDSIKSIVDRLRETDSAQDTACSSKLLEACPLVLLFRFEPNRLIPCSLRLTNGTDKNVAFQLRKKTWQGECYLREPQYGLVPPGSVYTLLLRMEKQKLIPEQKHATFILESCELGDEALHTSEGQFKYETFFEDAKGTGTLLQEMTLKAVLMLQNEMMSKQVPLGIKISYVEELYQALHSMDTDPTKQWIITGEAQGRVCILDYRTQRNVSSFKVSRKTVSSVKFITRKEWFVAGSEDGFICVYKYGTKMRKITRFKAGSSITSLAIHPNQPYVLSSLADGQMKLWDWDKGWKCIQTFTLEDTAGARQVAFNPMDTNCLASVSEDHTLKVWNLDSPDPSYTLYGHSEKVNCLYFFTRDDQQYLITGSDDRSAKIWDLQKKACVCTMDVFLSPITSVISHPNLQDLITVTKDGTVHLWASTNSRIYSVSLKGILSIPGRILPDSKFQGFRNKDDTGSYMGLSCLMGSRRIVIGQGKTVAVMDIDNADHMKEPTDDSEQWLSTDSRPKETTHEGSSELLHVHPIELHVPFEESNGEGILCRLYLTNNTDEHVVFWLTDVREPNLQRTYGIDFMLDLPVYGIVPPRCSYTLGLTAAMPKKIAEETNFDMILHSCILGDNYIHTFEDDYEWEHFVEEAKMIGIPVHEVAMKAVLVAPEGETNERTGLLRRLREKCSSLDLHPTEPWVVVAEDSVNIGKWVSLWNPDTKCKTDSFEIGKGAYPSVRCSVVTFIARKEWLMAGTSDGVIHVFNYKFKIQRITSFRAHETSVKSLVVHPTKSYVLSTADDDNTIKLWDWNDGWEDFIIDFKGWQCIRKFNGEHSAVVNEVAIDPKDTNRFASASDDHTIKLWNLHSPGSYYTLSGHSDKVNSLNFFIRDDQHYLITGSDDLTSKVWHIQKRICVHTLEAFTSPVTCVLSHPNLPVLLSGTKSGDVYFCSSSDYRLKRVVCLGNGGAVVGIACPMKSNRVVIGHNNIVAITDIDDEE